MTPEVERLLVRLAEEQRVTVPRLLVEAATAESGGETSSDRRDFLTELFGVHRALGAVGNNLNQLAKKANANGESTVELAHTLAAVRRQLTRLDLLMDGYSSR